MNFTLRHFSLILVTFLSIFMILGLVAANLTDTQRIEVLETQVYELQVFVDFPTPTNTPYFASPTITSTRVPPNTPSPEGTEPTREALTTTFTATPTYQAATNTKTPTRTSVASLTTPTPTVDPYWYLGCEPDGVFVASRNINRRTGPGTNYPVIYKDGKAFVILKDTQEYFCFKSMTDLIVPDTLIWVQASYSTSVYFVVGYVNEAGVVEWWGTLEILRD